MLVDHVEQAEREGADLLLRGGRREGGPGVQHGADDGVGRGVEQLALVRHVPVPRSAGAAADGSRLHELMFGDDAPRGLVEMFTGIA